MALLVYLGIIARVNAKLEFSDITMVNAVSDNEERLQIIAKADEFYWSYTLE